MRNEGEVDTVRIRIRDRDKPLYQKLRKEYGIKASEVFRLGLVMAAKRVEELENREIPDNFWKEIALRSVLE